MLYKIKDNLKIVISFEKKRVFQDPKKLIFIRNFLIKMYFSDNVNDCWDMKLKGRDS
ncbi:MAG: hypothetical protein PHW56_04870 [Methanosarcinaceae archaeon]|nr:hypothetical protein [Methanosarcinaceae archaeon]